MKPSTALRITAWVVLADILIDAALSILKRWPYALGGLGSPDEVVHDFLTSKRSALAPPFYMVVILALLCEGLHLSGGWKTWLTALMIPAAHVLGVGALGELLAENPYVPVGVRILDVLNVVLCLLLAILAVAALVVHVRQ